MRKSIFLIFLLALIIIGLIGILYINNHKPIILVNNEITIVTRTTNGTRARIRELQKEGKGIYEIADTLEDEGYIRGIDKE